MELIEAQQQYKDAREQLDAIILEMCPGQHRLVQHRDGGPPYCPACGRDQLGNSRRPPEVIGFNCPRCGMVSFHPMDAKEGYCGNCHDWTAQ